MDDQLYNELVWYFTNTERKYPAFIYDVSDKNIFTNEKSKFRRLAKPYHVKNGLLMHDNKEVLVRSRVASRVDPSHGGKFEKSTSISGEAKRREIEFERKSVRKFNPVSLADRKRMSETHGLNVTRYVYFGNTSKLSKPRRIHRTRGDGNCYFRCISFILTGAEDQHTAVRDCVVQHMLRISDELERYSNQNIDKYLSESRMNEEGVWATDAEIKATANLFGIDIHVYCDYGRTKDWLTYPADFNLSKEAAAGFYLENEGEHFNVVLTVEH